MARSGCGTAMLVLATIMGPIVLVFLSVSFATDHWLEFDVNRGQLSPTIRSDSETSVVLARYTHTRHRGLFRECYPGNDTLFLENRKATDEEIVDKYCFYVRYEIPEKSGGGDWSSEYKSRIHLMRTNLALFIIAIVAFLMAYLFGLVLCCWRQSKWAYIAGLMAYIAAFSTAASIAFFHGAEYLERNKIEDTDPYMGLFYIKWQTSIQSATDRTYAWSYILGWVGMVLAALTATFYSLAGCFIGGERYEDKEHLDKRSREYPLQLEPPYAEYYHGYPRGGYGYTGPYLYDMDARQPLPALTYGPQPAPVNWQWQ